MLKIDIHTHILPREWPDLKERYGYGGFAQIQHSHPGHARMVIDGSCFREIQDNCWDPEVRLEQCAKHGVDVQVLSTVPVMFSYFAKPHDGLDLAKMLNNHIASVVAQYPKRFLGLGTVPLQDPTLAITELERCMQELHLCGVQIGSHVNEWNLDAPELFSFFAAASDLGAAVFVHPWDVLGRERMPNFWLPWLVGMPAETALAICSLIFSGVLKRLPKLRIAFAHGGGAFPATIGRIAHGFAVRPDLCATHNDVCPREYLGQFYLDSLVHDEKALHYLLDVIGEDRIALGSDYPFPLGEAIPGQLIDTMTLSTSTKAKLLAGTALQWLGLPEQQFV